jgi:signal transduction histidine kinase
VAASFSVTEAPGIALAVLTDFERIPQFMPDMRSSNVLERTEAGTLVEQEAVARFMMFSKRVHLRLRVNERDGTIRFRDECGRSFARYEGLWKIAAKDGRTAIEYQLAAKPTFDVPAFVLTRLMKRDAAQMIARLQTEIARRASLRSRGARPVSPQPKRQTTEIDSLVRVTADLLRRDLSLAGVRIDVNGSAPPLMVDPEMMKMVIQNLLINGAHAMQSVGTIRVDIGVADDECSIAVSDSGPGIPADVRDKMFVPFFTTKSRGTGLGLPTAKRFIEAHHGQIVVDCPSSGGTTVTVQLPVS